ncbi:MAG TPA: sugar phosphate nucleotidyltransferase, partial [Gammaproteobacteria bacterium]|nr:sugar phosphate nucleotidyltransferase [Gammaproteobacteria bacterium]
MTSSKEQHHLYKYYVEPQAVSDLTRRTLVLVLAGGEGSRLKNLTKWRAKPAVPFGGKYRIIDFALSNCINSGLRRIGVLTQYKSHSLIRHLQRAWGFMRPEIGEFVEIIPAQQRLRPEWYQGTADAIYQNLDIVYRHEPDYVLVLGGDHIYTMNYAKMLAAHVQAEAELTIGCIEAPADEAKAFGVMSVDEDYRITRFAEKPADPECIPGKPGIALASMGIYIFSMEFLTKALIQDAENEASAHDFGKDIIPAAIENAKS